MSASIASGRLADDLNELTRAELEFIAHDWEIWARDDQLAPLLIAPGDSPAGSRPPGALDVARDSSNKPAASGRLAERESEAAIKQWRVWLLLGGRGSGKTRAGAEWVRSLARGEDTSPRATAGSPQGSRGAQSKNQPARIALVGKTLADVRNVMIEGQSGLLAIHPAHERPEFEPSKRRLTWPSGAIAELFSADEAEALRGPQFTAAWCDELAKWRGAERAWDMLQFALRLPDETVADIYRRRYFEPADCNAFTAPLALMHFDAAVNHGVGAAIRMLQQSVDVTIDGEIGPETLGAIGARNVVDLIEVYADIRRARYRALPHFWRFGRGWLKRVDATLALGKSWAANDGIIRGLMEPAQNAKGETTMSDNSTTATTDDSAKWWAQSKTLWGTLITAAATVLPLMAPAIGVSLPADVIQTFGDQAITAAQAVTGLIGTALAIYGRFTASSVLSVRKS